MKTLGSMFVYCLQYQFFELFYTVNFILHKNDIKI